METKSIQNKARILVILGPTATGKSDLAVKLAKKYNGEIISADSRQVYMGLNIGTGKITKKEMRGIPHHMIDIISPKKVFSVNDFQKQTEKIIADIISRRKLPIICGGTGFYIQSIVDGIVLPEVPPNFLLRKRLERKTLKELQTILKKSDPVRYKNIDLKNPVRLIRAIEIATKIGSVPKIKKVESPYQILQIGLKLSNKVLRENINSRFDYWVKKGVITETKKIHKSGLSWKRIEKFGLEYTFISNLLRNKISKEKMIDESKKVIWQYAKRQMTWFKRDKRINWFEPANFKNIESEIKNFLTK